MTTVSTERFDAVRTTKAIKTPARVATTANITLSGLQTIDDIALAASDRVLVKDQTDASQNGVYVAGTGAWARSKDFNSSNEIAKGTVVWVNEGTAGGGLMYTQGTDAPTIGTSNITFAVVASSITGYGATLVAAANAAAVRALLDLEPGTDVQAYAANLAALSGLTLAANKLPYATGVGALALADLTAFARTLLDDADAATARTTLGAIAETTGTHACAASPATSGSITLSGSFEDLFYVKQGTLCHITGLLEVASVSSPVGNEVFLTLPFVPRVGLTQHATTNWRDISAGNPAGKLPISVDFATTARAELAIDASTVVAGDRFQIGFTYITI